MHILISDKCHPRCAEMFREAGFDVDEKTGLKPDELAAIIGDYNGLVVRSATKVTAALLEAAAKMKVVGRAGAGMDNIDIPAATQKGVVVMNTPGQNSNAAAELAVGMMFALARNIFQGCSSLKACRWEKKTLEGCEIMGKTLGVVGYGNIGRIVGEIGKGLKMKVLAHDPYLSSERIAEFGAVPMSLNGLLDEADFVTLHIPRTKETANIINAEALARMRPGAYLVNCARGGLVDEEALYEALAAGRLGGAALDVFAKEPPGEHKLLELNNFICTPHLGASTREAQVNVAEAVARQMIGFLRDGRLENAVNA